MSAAQRSAENAAPASTSTKGRKGRRKPKTRRGRVKTILAVVAVAILVAAITFGVWWLPSVVQRATATPPGAGSVTEPSLDPLLAPEDAAHLAGATWLTAQNVPVDLEPFCLPVNASTLPTSDHTVRRDLTGSAGKQTLSMVNIVQTYPDAASATRAFSARAAQAGSCAGAPTALVVSTWEVTGLGRSAIASMVDEQVATPVHHLLLVSQNGNDVSTIDLFTTGDLPDVEAVALAATSPLTRLCSETGTTCPAQLAVKAALPRTASDPGWLLAADLPLLTADESVWETTRPTSSLTVTGSQCESIDLAAVTDATIMQRTSVLIGASQQQASFGIDQVNYTFPDASAAKDFQTKLEDNLANCGKRSLTATVKKGPNAKDTLEGLSGASYLITHQTAANSAARYRVAVLRVDSLVIYLLANPSTDLDFTDDQWKSLMVRAGERASRLS